MKFKFGDQITIDDEFYGEQEGVVMGYKTEEGKILYQVDLSLNIWETEYNIQEYFEEEQLNEIN